MATLTSQAVLYFNTSRWLYGQKIVLVVAGPLRVPEREALLPRRSVFNQSIAYPLPAKAYLGLSPLLPGGTGSCVAIYSLHKTALWRACRHALFTGQRCSFTAGMHIMHFS